MPGYTLGGILFGLALIIGSAGLLWATRGVVQALAYRRRLALGLVAWGGEALLLSIALFAIVGIDRRPSADELTLLGGEAPLALALVAALAVLAWAWGVPTFATIGLAASGPG